jgi:hypothetical protein
MNPYLILSALIAALATAGGSYFKGRNDGKQVAEARATQITTQWQAERQRIINAALAASENARQKEAAYANAVKATQDHYARESEITKAAAARAANELERLRVAVNAASARPGANRHGGSRVPADARELSAAVNASRTDEGASTAGVLLLTCSGRLREVAQVADELGDQIRGLHRHVESLLERIAGTPDVQKAP